MLDNFSISDAAYHEHTMFCNGLTGKYLVVQKRLETKEKFHTESWCIHDNGK